MFNSIVFVLTSLDKLTQQPIHLSLFSLLFIFLQRAFTYFVIGGARFIYASVARLAVINTVATLSPSADVMAMSTVEVDINNLQPGQVVTVKWRGKPVFIKRRTEKMVKAEEAVNISELRHAQTDAQRVKNPEYLIVLGVCTHLGCVPLPNAGDYNGWYCPCHGVSI
jgi:ubiquinol-cytochrome c reductase iron-sulfur subunit